MVHQRLLSGALIALLASPGVIHAQSPSPSPLPSTSASEAPAVQVVGPDSRAPVPSPPIGPEWQVVLDRAFRNVLQMEMAACGDGFALLVYGTDDRDRPRALVWTSSDGVAWSRGQSPRPVGDPIAGHWAVFELVAFRGELWALGGEDRRLVGWRSPDCGRTWRRIRERPVFFIGGGTVALNSVSAAATDETLLVLGAQAGERLPYRRFAWTLDAERGWRRIRGGLEGVVDFGLDADAGRFTAVRLVNVPDDVRDSQLITSVDGRRWEAEGLLPDRMPVIPDPSRRRLLIDSEVVQSGQVTPQIQSSTDDRTWQPLLRATASIPSGSSAHLFEADGALVWIVDIVDAQEENPWSWIAVSEDGGDTWSVSAGWPGMRFLGLTAVAADDDAVVLVVSGDRFDAIRVWTLPRE